MKTILIAAAASVAFMSAGPARACMTISEEMRIGYAGVVVDGVAACDVVGGTCRLRAREVIKDVRREGRDHRVYRFHFSPGADEALRREFEETGVLNICASPWEPRGNRIEGRFYLDYGRGRLIARQESARGAVPDSEEEAE